MRKIFLIVLIMVAAVSGYSQTTADIGIWGGGAGYMGDIEGKTLNQLSYPFLGAYFRYNFHYRMSARLMFLTGNVEAEGQVQNQPWSFAKPVQDLTLQAEINYLRYMLGNRKASFTSYLTVGLGVMYYPFEFDPVIMAPLNPGYTKYTEKSSKSAIAPTLPFGIGFKFNVGKRMGIGAEYQMRKIFDDKLDNLDDPLSHKNADGGVVTYTDYFHNNDWAGFLGLHLTYKIYLGSKPCPAYDVKN